GQEARLGSVPVHIRPYDIGCEPSPSGAGETLLQFAEAATYLVFFAVSKDLTECRNLGWAVVLCRECEMTKFGYPNDEGLPEHPLFELGLADAESVLEVVDSKWEREVSGQKIASARRIFQHSPEVLASVGKDRSRSLHFIVICKESTFECIASALTVDGFYAT